MAVVSNAIVVPAANSADPEGLVRPLAAGCGIKNAGSGEFGTLGLLLTGDGEDRWALGCYHVLGRPYVNGIAQPFQAGDQIYQPDEYAGGPAIATIDPAWFRSCSDRWCDAAAVRLDPGIPCSDAILGVAGIARITGTTEPVIGMKVIKSGRATGVTRGEITSIRTADGQAASIEVVFDLEADDGVITKAGDSGAVWIDSASGLAVAMNYGATAFGLSSSVVLNRILPALGLQLPP